MQAAVSGNGAKTLEHLAAAGAEALVVGKTLGLELLVKMTAESIKLKV